MGRADSKSEITMFLVEYKESRAAKWTSMEVTPSQGQEWRGTTLLSHLQSATQYQARVSSRNMLGYSHPAMLNFATKGAVPYHQPSVSGTSIPNYYPTILFLTSLVIFTRIE